MRERFRIDVVIALAVMVALIVTDAQVGRPRRAAAVQMGERVRQAESELRYLAGHGAELGEIDRFLPRASRKGTQGGDRFLSEASNAARELHLAITKVEPGPEDPYGSYVARHYKISFEASYSGFVGFLRVLETLPEVVIVTGMDCSSKELTTGRRHRMNLEVTVVGH